MEMFASWAHGLGWKAYELIARHNVILTHPKELADILLRISSRKDELLKLVV
jgi:hypothetical protein